MSSPYSGFLMRAMVLHRLSLCAMRQQSIFQFIRPGNGYEQVGVLDARLGLDGVRCTVARDAHDIQLGCQPIDARGIGVHNRNIVAFLVELGGECRPTLPQPTMMIFTVYLSSPSVVKAVGNRVR